MSQQGSVVELEINDLSSSGDGVGRLDGKVIFVPNTVTGDRVLVKLVRVKSQYAHAKLEKILQPSPHRLRPRCIVADKCGGCQWQHIDYQYQLQAKQTQIKQALERLGNFSDPPLADMLASPFALGYRNKATYPLRRSTASGQVQAGYYRSHSHALINLNQCPVQDRELNPFLAEIKQDIQNRGWSIYQETLHRGKLRHLSLRIGRRTQEVLLTLITNNWQLPGIEEQAQIWLKRYPQLVGVCLNYNPERTNVIFGKETRTIAGRGYLSEKFADLDFQLRPETFFQVNTEAAEAVLETIREKLALQGREILVDAYCGIGTFTLPLSRQVHQAIGIEIQEVSVTQAKLNAELNGIDNVNFYIGNVETILPQFNLKIDVLILDPPRKGCSKSVISTVLKLQPKRIVYLSCQPATLARDLALLCADGMYQLQLVQAADFFPQTSHVEAVAFLDR